MPRKWREKEARKIENVMGDCVMTDLERVGGELRTTAEDRRGKKRQRKDDSNHGQPPP